MSAKRRRKNPRKGQSKERNASPHLKSAALRSKRLELVLALVVVASALVSLAVFRDSLFRSGPAVPAPDPSAMEPRVAAKIEEARRAVVAAPDSHEAWGHLGMVLHAHRLESDAVVCYRRAAELAPSEFRWHYLLAHALRFTDAAGALTEAEVASRLDPSYAPVHVLSGQLLEGASQPEEALSRYQKAAEIDRENAMAAFGLGRIHLARGELEDALKHLLLARDLSQDAPAIHGALAQAYRQLGDRDSALRENRLASEVTETIPIRDPIHYAMRKESVSSTALLERAIEADGAGDFKAAEPLYEELVRLRPEDANIHARFGDTLARQSKIQPAKEQYQAALSINSALPSAHYGLGNMLNFEGDYDGAARQYRAALETRPEHVPTLVNLSGLLAFQGQLGEAALLCQRALALDPKGFDPNFHLGRVMIQQSKFRDAIPFLGSAIAARPDSGPAHLQLSIALVGIGDYRAAWAHVERAQSLGEKVPQPLVDELRRRVGRG